MSHSLSLVNGIAQVFNKFARLRTLHTQIPAELDGCIAGSGFLGDPSPATLLNKRLLVSYHFVTDELPTIRELEFVHDSDRIASISERPLECWDS